jgi:hypothetical protein
VGRHLHPVRCAVYPWIATATQGETASITVKVRGSNGNRWVTGNGGGGKGCGAVAGVGAVRVAASRGEGEADLRNVSLELRKCQFRTEKCQFYGGVAGGGGLEERRGTGGQPPPVRYAVYPWICRRE